MPARATQDDRITHMKRAFGALGTSILAGGCAAAMPLFAAVLAATLGTLVIVGLYALRVVRRLKR